jgi:ABC-2 type transport system permease protein
MIVIIRMTSRLISRGRMGLFALLLGIMLFELIQPPIAAALGGPKGLEALLSALPPQMRALTRARPELIAMSGLAGYLSLGFTHIIYLVLTSVALLNFATRTLAGEMERGSIQLALSRPISRAAAYAARVLGVAVVAVLLAAAGPVGMIGGLLLARPGGELTYRYFLPTAITAALLFWAIGGLALFGSAAADSAGRAVGWAVAALVVFYFVDYFATIWSFLQPIEFLSIFDYYDPGATLVYGALPWTNVIVLGTVGLAGALAGLTVFVRRDLPT